MSKLLNISIALDQHNKFSLISSKSIRRNVNFVLNLLFKIFEEHNLVYVIPFWVLLSRNIIRFAELIFTWKLFSIFLQNHYSYRCSQIHTHNTNLLCNDFFVGISIYWIYGKKDLNKFPFYFAYHHPYIERSFSIFYQKKIFLFWCEEKPTQALLRFLLWILYLPNTLL